MALRFPNLDFKSLPFAENLNTELLGGVVALVAVGFTVAYIYYRTKHPKGIYNSTFFKFICFIFKFIPISYFTFGDKSSIYQRVINLHVFHLFFKQL